VPQRRLRATERRRRERARGAARAPRRCACSPLGERATVEWPQRRFFASARPDEAASNAPSRSRRRRRSRGGAPVRSRARLHTDEPWICGRRWLRGNPGKKPTPPSLSFFLSFFFFFHSSSSTSATDKQPSPALVPNVGYFLLGARSDGYNVRRDRFVVPRPKP
jgi:hypothetical protein